jgi:hypothetical protein
VRERRRGDEGVRTHVIILFIFVFELGKSRVDFGG